MTRTVSKVLMNREDYNQPLIDTCMSVHKMGGSFSITNVLESGGIWYTIYTIDWPEYTPQNSHCDLCAML